MGGLSGSGLQRLPLGEGGGTGLAHVHGEDVQLVVTVEMCHVLAASDVLPCYHWAVEMPEF